MRKNNEIRISNEDVISVPGNRNLFGVDENDWERLRIMIIRYSKASDIWLNVAIAFLSAALTLITAYLTLDEHNKWKATLQNAFFITLTAGALSLIYWFLQKKNESTTKDDILEQMKTMRNITQTQERKGS
jgi:hypothetical protein